MILSYSTHIAISIVSLYLFFLFTWWWILTKKATMIFGFTCFLMLGLALHYGIDYFFVWSCKNRVSCEMYNFKYVFIRDLFVLIPLGCYAYYVTRKFIYSRFVDYPIKISKYGGTL